MQALSAPALCQLGDMQTSGTLSQERAQSTVIVVIQSMFGWGLYLSVLSWQEILCKELTPQAKRWWPWYLHFKTIPSSHTNSSLPVLFLSRKLSSVPQILPGGFF